MPARYAAVDSAALLGERATIRVGYAVREKKCLAGQRDCGPSAVPFHACCTENTFCASLSLNARCCEPDEADEDCADRVEKDPKCANAEHDMYDNDGFFCCDQDKKGYRNQDADGCADQDYVLKGKEEWLTIYKSGEPTTTSKATGKPSATSPSKPSSTHSTADPTTTSDDSSSSSSSSSTGTSTIGSSSTTSSGASAPTIGGDTTPAPSTTSAAAAPKSSAGPIAGGVIGGLAALAIIGVLIWWLRRRKSRSYASTDPASPSGAYRAVDGEGTGPEKDVPLSAMGKSPTLPDGSVVGGASELPDKERGGSAGAAELYGQEGKRVAEMYAPGERPVELHGMERGPGELPAWDGSGQIRPGERGGPVELP